MIKKPLDFALYEELGINPLNIAYEFIYENLTNQEADEKEDNLISQKFQIVKIETSTQLEGRFKVKIIAIEPKKFTF